MSGDLFQKYLNPASDPAALSHLVAEEDDFGDVTAFGFLRGIRDRAIMLELRHRDGRVTALSYAWLEAALFNPSEGISLNFGDQSVQICGRNLNAEVRPNVRLFAGILRHRVAWIQEADEPSQLTAVKGATIIESIEVK